MLLRLSVGSWLTLFLSLFNSVQFPQLNGDLGTSQMPTAAAAQAQAAAVAAAQQHRQPSYDATPPASVQPQNPASQASSMTSPPLSGRMSPHHQMPVQTSATPPQAQTTQPSAAPVPKQPISNQMSPSGQMMTPPRSQGKTPPRESGKNLGNSKPQAQSPASQGDQSNSSGYISATESKPNIQSQLMSIKTEPATPPPPQPQTGQSKVGLPYCNLKSPSNAPVGHCQSFIFMGLKWSKTTQHDVEISSNQ